MDLVEQRLMPLLGQGFLKSFSIQSPAFGGNAGDQTGFVIMILEDWNDRTVTAQEALSQVRKALAGIPDVRVFPFMPGFVGALMSLYSLCLVARIIASSKRGLRS